MNWITKRKEKQVTEDTTEGKEEIEETIKLSQEMTSSEDAKADHMEDKSDKATGSHDAFTPQGIKETLQSCKQEDREQKSSSSPELDVTNEQVIKKEVEDVKEQANEGTQKSKEKDEKEKKETLFKKEVTPKEGWMRQK